MQGIDHDQYMRWGRIAAATFALMVLIVVTSVWMRAFRTPPVDPVALPEPLIALESNEGQAMLAEAAFKADAPPLRDTFVSQLRPGYCGVASATAVLNALALGQPSVSQETFFSPQAEQVRGEWRVTFGGMTLEQLAGLLVAHGAKVVTTHATDSSVGVFRKELQRNLAEPGDFLLVNYTRAVLEQGSNGHISPVAAYDETSDRALVLDVAAYRYPPTWIPVDLLWKAMNTPDRAARKSRGYLVVSAPEPNS